MKKGYNGTYDPSSNVRVDSISTKAVSIELSGGGQGTVTNGSSANRMYGLSFWSNQNASRPAARSLSVEGSLGSEFPPAFWQDACLSKNAPADLLAMIGSGGQRAYVVPSQGLVVVRFGSGSRFDDAEFLDVLFGRSAQAASGRAR